MPLELQYVILKQEAKPLGKLEILQPVSPGLFMSPFQQRDRVDFSLNTRRQNTLDFKKHAL